MPHSVVIVSYQVPQTAEKWPWSLDCIILNGCYGKLSKTVKKMELGKILSGKMAGRV